MLRSEADGRPSKVPRERTSESEGEGDEGEIRTERETKSERRERKRARARAFHRRCVPGERRSLRLSRRIVNARVCLSRCLGGNEFLTWICHLDRSEEILHIASEHARHATRGL